MVIEIINIPSVELEWCEWVAWNNLKVDARDTFGIKVPNKAGIYEVKYVDTEERLTIGKAKNLSMRVKQGLVKGTIPHSTGEKIRPNEDVSKIIVRWAVTDRPAAVEEELHKRYQDKFGKLPKYTKHT
ncbi:MAG TPA: hypothetical protein ACFYD6_09805 [Candidatus Brocadiia bacterium]|nr:hypothetical protein [Candidatus Brocadiales bacterium]